MAKKKRRHYKNPNGNMTIEDMIKIKHKGKIENFLRCFKLLKMPCPPKQLMASSIRCFFCVDCFKHAFSKIKELKTYYKVKDKKYPKEEFDED